jgi:hypothetical protein
MALAKVFLQTKTLFVNKAVESFHFDFKILKEVH